MVKQEGYNPTDSNILLFTIEGFPAAMAYIPFLADFCALAFLSMVNITLYLYLPICAMFSRKNVCKKCQF